MRNCTCEKWDDNIYILNAPYTLNMSAIGEYAGDDFVYCPWCGMPVPAPPGVNNENNER